MERKYSSNRQDIMKQTYMTPVMEMLTTEGCHLLNGSVKSLDSTKTLQKYDEDEDMEGIGEYKYLL